MGLAKDGFGKFRSLSNPTWASSARRPASRDSVAAHFGGRKKKAKRWPSTATRPASSESAAARFGPASPSGQHHQHQLQHALAQHRHKASIVGISCSKLTASTATRPASSASAAARFGSAPRQGQHHQHQLQHALAQHHQAASIISISCSTVWVSTTTRPASSTSAAARLGPTPPSGQHHRHQLQRIDGQHRHKASIISISWSAF